MSYLAVGELVTNQGGPHEGLSPVFGRVQLSISYGGEDRCALINPAVSSPTGWDGWWR